MRWQHQQETHHVPRLDAVIVLIFAIIIFSDRTASQPTNKLLGFLLPSDYQLVQASKVGRALSHYADGGTTVCASHVTKASMGPIYD